MFDNKKVSVFTTCQNRESFLLQALPTWLAVNEIDEVVIVDWSSVVPLTDTLREHLARDSRLVLGVVTDHRKWHLTKCGNLAISLTTGDIVFHLDADVLILPSFKPECLHLEEGHFKARYPKRSPLWGSFLVYRTDLLAVNGYNERIIGYAQDDEDLYDRLIGSGCRQVDMFHEYLLHLDHGEDLRLNTQTESITESLVNARRIMREAPWTTKDRPTKWSTERHGNVVYCTEE